MYFEDVFKQPNLQTYYKLSLVHSAIMLWCYFNDIKFTILAPSHWRKILKEKYKISFGKARQEQKQKAIELVQEQCGQSVSSDEADAICIGIAGMLENNKRKSAF